MKKRRSLVIVCVLLLALALTFTLAACDPKGQETPPTQYTVTFVGAGEAGADMEVKVNAGQKLQAADIPTVPAKTDCSNDGKWYVADAQDQPTDVEVNADYAITADVKAVPKYICAITFEGAEGTGGQQNVVVEVAYGAKIAPEDIPEAADNQEPNTAFHYWGWKTPYEGHFDPDQPITHGGNVQAYYDNIYNVSYFCGIFSGLGPNPAEPADMFAGDVITLLANTYTRYGYTFKGWNIQSRANEEAAWADIAGQTNLQSGATYAIPAETAPATQFRITAQWEQQYLHITFDANGGSGEMAAKDDVKVNNGFGDVECTFTAPAGQRFYSWGIKKNGEDQITPISQFIFNDFKDAIVVDGDTYSLTIYALWTRLITIDNIKGVWTAAGHEDLIISDYMANEYVFGTAIYNGELIALADRGLADRGEGQLGGSTSTYEPVYIAVAEDNSTLTIGDVVYSNKAAIANANISDFAGKWARNNANYYITADSKAYYGIKSQAFAVQIIDKYIVIITVEGEYDMGTHFVLYKNNDGLKGWYTTSEVAPAEAIFAAANFAVLSVDGAVNQLVNNGATPNADALDAAKHPQAGFEFEKWVKVDGEADFDAAAALTEDVNIKAVYKPAGITYTANTAVNEALGVANKVINITSFILNTTGARLYITGTIDGKAEQYYQVVLSQNDGRYGGAKKALLVHYYTFEIAVGVPTMGIAIFSDGSATFCNSSADDVRISENVYTRDGGNASFEADIKTFAKKEGVSFTASSYPVVLTSVSFDVNLIQPVTKVTLTGKYNGGDLNVKEMELKVDANGKLFFDFQRFADDGATTKVELQLSDDKSSITLSTPTLTGDGVLPEGTLSPDEPDEPQEKDEYNFTGSLAIQNTSGVSKTLTKINIKTADKSGEGKYNTITVTLDGSDIKCNNYGINFEASINANQCSVKVGTTWTKILYISFDIKAGTATIYDNSKAKIGEFKDESVAPAEPEQKSEYVFTGNYTLTVGANSYNITAIKVKTADLAAGKTDRYDKITLTIDGTDQEFASAANMDDLSGVGDYVKVNPNSSSSVIYIVIDIEAGTATIRKSSSVVATFTTGGGSDLEPEPEQPSDKFSGTVVFEGSATASDMFGRTSVTIVKMTVNFDGDEVTAIEYELDDGSTGTWTPDAEYYDSDYGYYVKHSSSIKFYVNFDYASKKALVTNSNATGASLGELTAQA